MPQKLLAVLPSEILHLELECPNQECRALESVPLIEWNPDHADRSGRLSLWHCPWCNLEFPIHSRDKVVAFLNALRQLRSDGAPNLRIIIQDRDRND